MRIFFFILMISLESGLAQTSVSSVVNGGLTSGYIALEDGFSSLAEATFKSCIADGSLSGKDAVDARQYLLQALFDQSKFDEMHSTLEKYVSEKSLSGDLVTYWRAMTLHGQSHYAEAAEALVDFGETWPKSEVGESALRLQGHARVKSGDVAGATTAFELLVDRYPKSASINLNRLDWGKALIFQGELKSAIKVLKPVMSDAEGDYLTYEARYWIGKAQLQLKDIEKGLGTLEPLAENGELPEGLRVNVVLALSDAFVESESFDKAITLLTKIVAAISDETQQLRLTEALCNVLLTASRIDEAMPLIKKYVSEYSDVATAAELQLKLGGALLDEKRFAEAIPIYQQYIESFANAGNHAEARAGQAWALLGVDRFAEAAAAFEKAYDLFISPEQKATCLYKMADARFSNSQYQQALEIYGRFCEAFPKSVYEPNAMLRKGECLESLAQYAEAEAMYERVAGAHPKSPIEEEALFSIGELRQGQGDSKGAEAAFGRVMSAYPTGLYMARSLYGRGMSRYQQWIPEALEDFASVVSRFPDSDVATHSFFMQALCLFRLGKDDQALEVCRMFLVRYPDSDWAPSVRFWVGQLAYNTGAYETAETEFISFMERYPDNALTERALFRAGLASSKRKEYVRAIELLGQFSKTYPSSMLLAEARFHQADAMTQLGKFAGAILVFEEIVNNYPSSEFVPLAWGRKGDCQFTLGAEDSTRYEEAIRSYRVVAHSPSARPDHIWQADYKLGRCLEKLGRLEEAQTHYYANVMVPFLLAKSRGDAISESAKIWFIRAAQGATDIVTRKEDWRKLVRILERVVEADVSVSDAAKARIKVIKSDNWWLFY